MATVTVNDSNLYDIADSIRAKLGVQTTYKPSEMADAIDSISGGSTWTEYTATSGASNAQTCANLLFPSQTSGKHYFAYLIDKDVSNFVNNQFVMLSWYRNGNSMIGGGTRYKSGAYGNLQGISNSYDAVIETGDKFMVCEM